VYKVGIMGATGFTGSELIRILNKHPKVELVYLGSNSKVGQNIKDLAPELEESFDKQLEDYQAYQEKDLDLIFLALPHGVAMDEVKHIWENSNVKIIDLSADFRFRSQKMYELHYKEHIIPQLLSEAVYGLPELSDRKKIANARLVANPGCYVTAATLALKPIIDTGDVVAGSIIIDAKSGYSGAGRAFAEKYQAEGNGQEFKAYKVAQHRHQPEIEQNISDEVVFVPHLLPVYRGILSTIYLDLKADSELTEKEIEQLYLDSYQNEPFVKVCNQPPDIADVINSNNCHLWYKYLPQQKKLILVTVIDNLIKGASGQAVQNMNLMLGLPETMALENIS